MIDPEPVDVVVSETLGNFAFEEHLLETMNDARRFLRSGGTCCRSAYASGSRPCAATAVHRELTVWREVGYGLDFEPAVEMSLNNLYVRSFAPAELSVLPAQCCDEADLRRANRSRREGGAGWRCERARDRVRLRALVGVRAVAGDHAVDEPARARARTGSSSTCRCASPSGRRPATRSRVTLRSDTGGHAGISVRWRVRHEHAGRANEQSLDIAKGYLG